VQTNVICFFEVLFSKLLFWKNQLE